MHVELQSQNDRRQEKETRGEETERNEGLASYLATCVRTYVHVSRCGSRLDPLNVTQSFSRRDLERAFCWPGQSAGSRSELDNVREVWWW